MDRVLRFLVANKAKPGGLFNIVGFDVKVKDDREEELDFELEELLGRFEGDWLSVDWNEECSATGCLGRPRRDAFADGTKGSRFLAFMQAQMARPRFKPASPSEAGCLGGEAELAVPPAIAPPRPRKPSLNLLTTLRAGVTNLSGRSSTAPTPLCALVDVQRLLASISRFEKAVNASVNEHDLITHVPVLDRKSVDDATTVYTHMMAAFHDVRYKQKYGHTKIDQKQPPLLPGHPVPSYFANVVDQSIHRRKVLSMAGLRNLVAHGAQIYKELKDAAFVSNPSHYGPDAGINNMRKLTGNVVDLDTCVLRPSDGLTMKAINAVNEKQGLPVWSRFDSFGTSDQAYDIAENAASSLLEEFSRQHNLTDAQAKARKVHHSLMRRPVPVAKSNSDRGKWPLWHYVNVGQDSFHCNVPCMADVNGALLKAPLRCVRIYLEIHAMYGSDPVKLRDHLDAFYEDAIADACFNMKWKAIEEFGASMASKSTIAGILAQAHADRQVEFMKVFDTDDPACSKEKKLLWSFVDGMYGRWSVDADEVPRRITRHDVDRWVDDPRCFLMKAVA